LVIVSALTFNRNPKSFFFWFFSILIRIIVSSLQCPYADSSYQAVFLPPVPVSTFFFFRHACCSFLVLGEMMKHRFHNNQLSLGGRSLNPTAPPPAVPPRVSPSMVGSSATSKAPCNVNVNLYSKQNEKKNNCRVRLGKTMKSVKVPAEHSRFTGGRSSHPIRYPTRSRGNPP